MSVKAKHQTELYMTSDLMHVTRMLTFVPYMLYYTES